MGPFARVPSSRRVIVAGLGILAVFLAHPALGAVTAPAPEKPAPAAAAAPAPAADLLPPDFHYDGTARRDPFKSLLTLAEKKRDVSLLPPIQQVDVLTFKILGIIIDREKGNRAMIKAPDGKTYVIKKGDIVGKNEGEVLAIELPGVSIREKFLDYMNKETYVNNFLKATDTLK